jgi:signal transduction histidine kinase
MLKSLVSSIQTGKFIDKVTAYSLLIDYAMLKKYDINERNNPQDAIIVNRPIPIWVSYPQETLFALITIILLSLLLAITFILKIRNERISKMEESMVLISRQAEMGEMISVIAHQWRQPLNIISLLVQTILSKYKQKKLDDTSMDKFVADTLKQIFYMSDTVDDFKDFYKPTKGKSNFDIKEQLIKTIELIEQSYVKDDIVIKRDEIDNFQMIGYPNELSHCFLIILNNAKDALLNLEQQEQKVIKISSLIKKDSCIISFENNGEIISNNLLNKIFEPYFSTKNEKNGTGLGLYMVKTIIEKHFHGYIRVANTSFGVKFEIELLKNHV